MASALGDRNGTAVGIDLGTTFCAVGVCINGTVQIIPNQGQGTRLTPSYVAYQPSGKTTYGRVAKEQSFKNPECTIFDAKRMIWRNWNDPTLQKDILRWPFKMVEVKGVPKIKIGSKTRYPQEVSAKLLSIFCRHAEEYLGKDPGSINKAVITVPAYFSESQRRATLEAGEAAGLEVLTILNEPTAAAIAYLRQSASSENQTCLIYDLGGGTFDVSIVKVGKDEVETLGVGGDTHLGGQDFDRLLLEYCALEFHKEKGIHLLQTKKKLRNAVTRIRLQCEVAKLTLSSSESTVIDIQKIYKDVDLNITVTRTKLEELIQPLLDRTIEIVKGAIKEANGIKGKEDIDKVILVGGSTRIPLVKNLLQKLFVGKEILSSINPDEAVAYGAAMQADILSGGSVLKHFQVEDVTPMSLGIKVEKFGEWNFFQKIIPKNYPVPCEFTATGFTTMIDNQDEIIIPVHQGESVVASENEVLGEFRLGGIPIAPKGEEKMEVKMKIDTNGILTVTATSMSTRNSTSLQVRDNRFLMDREAIDRLAKEFQRKC